MRERTCGLSSIWFSKKRFVADSPAMWKVVCGFYIRYLTLLVRLVYTTSIHLLSSHNLKVVNACCFYMQAGVAQNEARGALAKTLVPLWPRYLASISVGPLSITVYFFIGKPLPQGVILPPDCHGAAGSSRSIVILPSYCMVVDDKQLPRLRASPMTSPLVHSPVGHGSRAGVDPLRCLLLPKPPHATC